MRFVGLLAAILFSASPAFAAAPTVKLLSAGKGKKTKLRFVPKKGAKQTVEFTMGMTMSMKMGAMAMPANTAPATVLTMETTVTDVSSNGDVTYSFVFKSLDLVGNGSLPAEAVAEMKKATKELTGTKGIGKISSTGYNLGANFELPKTASPQAKQTLEGMKTTLSQFAAPVPNEAVGVGGKWRVDFETDSAMGIQIKQAMTYTVKSLKGSRVELGVEVDQKAASNSGGMPGLPPGVQSKIVSLDSKGGGNLTLDTTRAVPIGSSLKIGMNMKAEMTAGGQSQPLEMKMDMDVKMASR